LIGIDTNVLVRYILDDDPVWSVPAQHFIDHDCTLESPGFINLVVLVELVWVLKQTPSWGKDEICTVVSELLLADNIVVENADLVATTLEAYKKGHADFPDFIIAAVNQAAGVTHTVTIDKVASAEPGFARLTKRVRP
jgi:predicted nucleic-acid-binding protein